ncbi:hypothetical protein BDP55DRAFT_667051 [Colletotrichum godetiae]|uniref:Uncharacterized protein n=1 Tax=Colletotrichum godetiae TaxID=1209918 RepID=A0AAJ0AIQ6_9PEZI|nr:uncharacterized protein BDP55DRAFT_667051 [Colletotrichum godetiae]KAK1674636.1 hypothetical protein BDP55DRAFT_667051 [Colletotrichum godetiae]
MRQEAGVLGNASDAVGIALLLKHGVIEPRGFTTESTDGSRCTADHWTGCYRAGCDTHQGDKEEHRYYPTRKWAKAIEPEQLVPFLDACPERQQPCEGRGGIDAGVVVARQSSLEDAHFVGVVEQVVVRESGFGGNQVPEGQGGGRLILCEQLVFDGVSCVLLARSVHYSLGLVSVEGAGLSGVTLSGKKYAVEHSRNVADGSLV